MFSYTMEHIFSYTAGLQPPQIIGPVPRVFERTGTSPVAR